jgi:hypothetical protein
MEVSNPNQKAVRKTKSHPESKAEGRIFYLHSEHRPGFPRVTIAGHVNEDKQECYFGVSICDPRDQFEKKTGRIRAMGRAISTKRQILKIRVPNDPKFVRDKLHVQLVKIVLEAYSKQLSKYPELATATTRKQIAHKVMLLTGNV